MFTLVKSLKLILSKCSLFIIGAAVLVALSPLISLYSYAATTSYPATIQPFVFLNSSGYSNKNVSILSSSAATSYAGFEQFSIFEAYGFTASTYVKVLSSGNSTHFRANIDFEDEGTGDVLYWVLPSYSLNYDMWGSDDNITYTPINNEATIPRLLQTVSGTMHPIGNDPEVTYSFMLYEGKAEGPYASWRISLDGWSLPSAADVPIVIPLLEPQIFVTYEDATDAINKLQDSLLNPSPDNQSRTDYMQNEADRLDSELQAATSAATIPDYEFTPSLTDIPYTDTLKQPMDFIQTIPYFGTIAAVAVGFWVVSLLLYGVK